MAALILPLLIPVALWFGVRGMRRAAPDAWPPAAAKRSNAVRGLIYAGLSAVLWAGLFVAVWLLGKH